MNQEEADELVEALKEMRTYSLGNVYRAHIYAAEGKIKALIQAAVTPDEPEQGETVRVRIAVAVNNAGEWATAGESYRNGHAISDEMASGEAIQDLRTPGRVHFVEANIPLPTSVTVEGEVVS